MKTPAFLLFLFAVSTSFAAENPTAAENTIIAATDATNAPYELRGKDGRLEGFDVDIINAIAANQNMKVIILPHTWAGIFDALDAGEHDIIIAPLTITEARKKRVDFTIPYILPTRTAYLKTKTAKRLGIQSFIDLDKGTMAAKANTTNVSALEDFFGKDNPNIIPVSSQYLAFKAMAADKADSAFGDTLVLDYHRSHAPEIELLTLEQPMQTPVEAGFALKKGNQALKSIIDNGIRGIVKDGTYEKLARKWFGEQQGKKFTAGIKAFLTGKTD